MILARLRRELAKQAREFARPERRVRSLGKSVYYLGENRRILRRFFSPRITLIDANGKEVVFDFAKLLECDTSSCRFGSNRA